MLKNLLAAIEKDPKKIFILDGFGALFTAFSLGVVLVNMEAVFGIPRSTLRILSMIPLFYLVYDVFCYYKGRDHIGFWLKGIAILNVLYCPISMGFAIKDSHLITSIGWVYISLEILVILLIAAYEFKFANRLTTNT